MAKGLSPKQKQFVKEYLIDLNATQAAIRSGYSQKTAYRTGFENLRKPQIEAAIADAMSKREERTEITQDRVLQELAVVGFSNVRDYEIDDYGNLTLAEGVSESAYRAVSSFKKKIRHGEDGEITYDAEIRLWDKLGTLRLTAQHLGMLRDDIADAIREVGGGLALLVGKRDAGSDQTTE